MRAYLALAFLFSSASAGAEETEELPELVVEAVRDSVLPAHFAGSATVIDAEAIARSGARSVADILASQGGVRFTSTSGDKGGGSVHLRGFGENAASRVLVLIDGRPVRFCGTVYGIIAVRRGTSSPRKETTSGVARKLGAVGPTGLTSTSADRNAR